MIYDIKNCLKVLLASTYTGLAEESGSVKITEISGKTQISPTRDAISESRASLPPKVQSSPSPPPPPQAFRNTSPQVAQSAQSAISLPSPGSNSVTAMVSKFETSKARSAFKAAKNKSSTQRAFGMNFSGDYKIDKGKKLNFKLMIIVIL